MGHPIDFASSTAPLERGMSMVASHLLRAPQNRYRIAQDQQRLAQQGMVADAQSQNYLAQAEREKAEAGIVVERQKAFDRIMQRRDAYMDAVRAGKATPEDDRAFAYDLAIAFGKSMKDAADGLQTFKMQEMQKAGASSKEIADATGNTASASMVNAETRASSLKDIARSKPISVSRDSGVYDPLNDRMLVDKPNRPAGNTQNLYTPDQRALLAKAGEKLADAHAKGDAQEVSKWNQIIKGVRKTATIPERPMRETASAPMAVPAQVATPVIAPTEIVIVTDQAGYNALPSGAQYKDAQGNTRRKK